MAKIAFAKRYAVALGGVMYAFTLGLRQRRSRSLVHSIAEHFGYDDHPPRQLPRVDAARLTSPDTPVVVSQPDVVDGNVTLFELLVLSRLVRERAPKAIFEIGTFDGRTTLALAQNAPETATICTLDLPPATPTQFDLSVDDRKYVEKAQSGGRFIGTPAAAKIRQLYGDSGAFDFAPYTADFVFVDGSHTYDYVMSDSRRALQLLPNGRGTIVWHDYGAWEGVTRALNALAQSEREFSGIVAIEGTTLAYLDRANP